MFSWLSLLDWYGFESKSLFVSCSGRSVLKTPSQTELSSEVEAFFSPLLVLSSVCTAYLWLLWQQQQAQSPQRTQHTQEPIRRITIPANTSQTQTLGRHWPSRPVTPTLLSQKATFCMHWLSTKQTLPQKSPLALLMSSSVLRSSLEAKRGIMY